MIGVLLVASVAWLAAGCATGSDSIAPAPGGPDPDHVDRMRSLPYAGSTAVRPGEGSGVVLHDPERSCPGYTLVTVQMLARAELIDATGEVVHAWRSEPGGRWERAELLPDGGLLVVGADGTPGPGPGIPDTARYLLRLDRDGSVVWKRHVRAHHDVELQADGSLLALGFRRRREPDVHPRIDTRDDLLWRLDPEGNVVEERSLWDAFSRRPELLELRRGQPNALGVVPWFDPFHANSIEWVRHPDLPAGHPLAGPDRILFCLRHQDAIGALDWHSGEPTWVWGPGELLGPHDARLLPSGNILVFDNGTGRGWSRVIELDPLEERIVWEYRGSPPESFFTLSKGSSQRLPNGNTLIADSDNGRAFEITPAGETVWSYLCPHQVAPGRRAAIVRAIRYEPAFVDAIPTH